MHSVGGWVALVAVLLTGPREGRFRDGEPPRVIPAGNLPIAMLGVLLLAFGWLGFNGGSTLAFDERVPGVLVQHHAGRGRRLRGRTGNRAAVARLLRDPVRDQRPDRRAGGHHRRRARGVGLRLPMLIGVVGAVLMAWSSDALLHWRIDDAVGAIPAHLAAGAWGTLAVGLFGDLAAAGHRTRRGWSRLACRCWASSSAVCGAPAAAWLVMRAGGVRGGLRVDAEAERDGPERRRARRAHRADRPAGRDGEPAPERRPAAARARWSRTPRSARSRAPTTA
ncbi:MAG: hypothetical protein MZW92_76040 [Comamonadaceae bacterium]|nr:hypothetical protein [Comamonadaceae bacterium]